MTSENIYIILFMILFWCYSMLIREIVLTVIERTNSPNADNLYREIMLKADGHIVPYLLLWNTVDLFWVYLKNADEENIHFCNRGLKLYGLEPE
jgi:hypothetical protein